MAKKTVRDVEIAGKRLLVRVDFNVPLKNGDGIGNDRRIQAAIPTIQHALQNDALMVLMTHLGRPKGERDPKLSLAPVLERLRQLLPDVSVELTKKPISERVRSRARKLQPGEILLLENLRFHPGEKEGDEQFARQLRELGDIFVNDAFAACHRKHASTYVVPQQFPRGQRVMGLLVENETQTLDQLLKSPKPPMIALLGGAKVSDKLGVIESLLDRVQNLFVGGAMAYTFLKAQGRSLGTSKVEDDQLDLARRLLDQGDDKIVLPEDHVIARAPKTAAEINVVEEEIPEGWCGLGIGPKTIGRFTGAIMNAATVLWNGPMGKFEEKPFGRGTEAIVHSMAENKAQATTIVGGGESGEAVEQLDLLDCITHVSTGGGAFLKYLEKSSLLALEVLDDKQ